MTATRRWSLQAYQRLTTGPGQRAGTSEDWQTTFATLLKASPGESGYLNPLLPAILTLQKHLYLSVYRVFEGVYVGGVVWRSEWRRGEGGGGGHGDQIIMSDYISGPRNDPDSACTKRTQNILANQS